MRDLNLLGELVCRQPEHDPDLWSEDETEGQAIALCRTCPVVTQCLDFATNPAHAEWVGHGVWGAVNARRRAAMMRARVNMNIDDRYQTVTIPAPRTPLDMEAFVS